MAILQRKRQLAAKVEATKGTAESLTNADAAFLVEDVRYVVGGDEIVRDPLRASLAKYASLVGAQTATITGRVEVKGSGTPGTEPSIGTLLKGMGFAVTDATASNTYAPNSTDASTDTLTMAVYNDGIISKMYGARGNFTLTWTANQVCYIEFTFMGIHHSVTNGSMLSSISYESTTPVPFRNVSASILGWSGSVFSSFSLDMANEVVVRDNANASTGLQYAIINNRDPNGTIDLDANAIETAIDIHGSRAAGTTGALSLTLPGSAGNICTITAPAMQFISVDDTDRDGVSVFNTTFKLRTAGSDDDDVSIAFT